MRLLILVFLVFINLFANQKIVSTTTNAYERNKNIWLKTYKNYKDYNNILLNIGTLEISIQKNRNNAAKLDELNKKLEINKSKIALYERNHSFDVILKSYQYDIPTITIYDYLFNVTLANLEKKILKYKELKQEFYTAKQVLQNSYDKYSAEDVNTKKELEFKEQIAYFNDYSENIEKMEQYLFEVKEELSLKYQEYKNEVLIKHITTFLIIIILYIFYKIMLFIVFYMIKNKDNQELEKNSRKILSLFFVLLILIFIVVRYINDFLYIITFLSVVAAALTIAMKEILLNIAGSIYIFFSSIIRVGDRIMVQFETKHTIGDIVSISFVKIKLNEVEDYSNIKEIKNVGRTIYIPSSFIFTKVFYNYSLKKHGLINDLIEFEFYSDSEFNTIEEITKKYFDQLNIEYSINFMLNSTKTGIIGSISYQTNYKIASQKRGEISIALLNAYKKTPNAKLKQSKSSAKKDDED